MGEGSAVKFNIKRLARAAPRKRLVNLLNDIELMMIPPCFEGSLHVYRVTVYIPLHYTLGNNTCISNSPIIIGRPKRLQATKCCVASRRVAVAA